VASALGFALLFAAYSTDDLRLRQRLIVAAFTAAIALVLASQKYSRGISCVWMLWLVHTFMDAVRNGEDLSPVLARGFIYPLAIGMFTAPASMVMVMMPSTSPLLFFAVIGAAAIVGFFAARLACNYIAVETAGKSIV